MPVEFIGMIRAPDRSETRPLSGSVIDPTHIVQAAQTHEAAGVDRVLDAAESGRNLLPLVRAAAGHGTHAIAT